MMLDIGQVVEYSNSRQARMVGSTVPCREYAAEDVAAITATARRLLSFTCQMGWAAVSELLLVVAQPEATDINELIEELNRISDAGLTLLHHAVRSRSAALVGFSCASAACMYGTPVCWCMALHAASGSDSTCLTRKSGCVIYRFCCGVKFANQA